MLIRKGVEIHLVVEVRDIVVLEHLGLFGELGEHAAEEFALLTRDLSGLKQPDQKNAFDSTISTHRGQGRDLLADPLKHRRAFVQGEFIILVIVEFFKDVATLPRRQQGRGIAA